jgi:hypothetical protein
MLVIGLVGGTEAHRLAVSRRLVEEGRQQALVVWEINGQRLGDGRAHTLERALESARAGRQPVRGMVFPHVLTLAEEAVVRRAGGVIWHLGAPLSAVVPIRMGDLLVTPKVGGYRQYLDPLEALSEALLQRESQRRPRPARRA